MDASQNSRLSIEERVKAIVELPSPETSSLTNAKPKELSETARAYSDMLLSMVNNQLVLPNGPVNARCPLSGEIKPLEGVCLWSRSFYTIGLYYDFAVNKLIRSRLPTVEKSVPGVDRLEELCATEPSRDIPQYKLAARFITCKYLAILFGSQHRIFLKTIPRMQQVADLCEHVLHDSLKYLQDLKASVPQGCHGLLLERLLQSSIELLACIYERSAKTSDWKHKPGPFSAIRLAELSLLASRDESVVAKWGTKQVERVFECQIALVFQSMGFYVTPARVGERAGDAICISSDQTCPLTILLETKTSKKPYSLPTKDGRALREYVVDIRRRLSSLPPLGLVLIVGQEPAGTLERKLRDLQASVEVPVRYCRAQEIAELRESLPSVVPLRLFVDALLLGPNVVPKGTAKQVAQQCRKIQRAHVGLVRSCMETCHPGARISESWMEHCDLAAKGECSVRLPG